MNYSQSTRQRIADIMLGCRVDRAASVLPQHGGADDVTYFTISTGKILMTMLVGEVTVDIDGANQIVITHNPTDGATAVLNTQLDVNSCVKGDVITITGALGDAMIPATAAGSVIASTYKGVILTPGVISFNSSGTSTTGRWKWSLFYVPMDNGAYVVAS